MAIRYENVPVGRGQHVRGIIEHVGTVTGDTRFPEPHQNLSFGTKFDDMGALCLFLTCGSVSDPNISFVIDEQPVRILDKSPAKALKQLPCFIVELENGIQRGAIAT